ncbi:hypothetical protein COEREDRAFT_83156 [Coemansia reversa NRRL 1564]|uniref:RED-like N-terminal domain-containing protein n=1 Tax=Coemansia reversa (strain ATCC 12441 / NRRL 1564) TaxID=763665 RepID=A0A2G5B567_COERN|nr:hypothetical protein COEREDRAFT_83156 [Coemansia reversa NRRL 1564]|eukprot:PIA13867.1 hypothetical protein COEREDRAFT_83156 [Coemansia reversa NRRL 1564]
MSSEQRALYEQSKYLGGDLEHTHLVKGLDFLLLEKMRKRSAGRQPTAVNAENLDDELERLQQGCGEVSSSDSTDVALKTESAKATTQLGTRIMEVLQRMALEKQKWKQHAVEDGAAGSTRISTTRNELFKPGHMYFELDLSTDGIAAGSRPLVTVRLRGQEEIDQISGDAPAVGGDVREDSSDSHVVSRVISAISLAYQKRHDWHHLKEKDTVSEATQSQQGAQELGMRQEQSKKPLSPSKSQCSGGPEVEEEEDIFAEAGVDYEVTITAPETSDSDRRAIHTGPEVPSSLVLLNGGCDSDDEEMFVEPYPESPKESSDDDGAVVAPYLDSIDSKNLADTTQVAAVINPFGEYQSESESDNNSE